MARLNIKPITKLFDLETVEGGQVTVRQFTAGDMQQLNAIDPTMSQEWSEDRGFGEVKLKRPWSAEDQRFYHVYLGLAGSNLEHEIDVTLKDTDGNERIETRLDPIFEFEMQGGLSRIKSENDFRTAWRLLPYDIAKEIHRCVLELNPQLDKPDFL